MNIFWREIKAGRKSLLIWSVGIILFMMSGMVKYESYTASPQSINEMIAKMPTVLKTILGLGTFDLTMVTGYYGMLFFYLVLMAAIYAVMLGANIISKEEQDKTAEFLFLKPISRNQVITYKLSACLVNIAIFTLVTFLSSILMVEHYSKGEDIFSPIIKLISGMFIIQLIFLSIGSAMAAVGRHPQKASSLGTGILLLTFFLSIIIDLNSRIENLKYLTPFKYFEAKDVLYGPGFQPVFLILSFGIIVLLLGTTYVFYQKRDLYL
ncbi:MAG: hypothetical protein AWM53_01006 [Candidatus Dichloromethanomonas elyunquensis]|nr:MAG: hypothetical protein AWM53_01006 [Candidatus Dichloromethanomonas elyunquensis]